MTTDTTTHGKVFLLDAMALIFRAHFAFIKNPRITSSGLNTSAVFGFINTLLEVINKFQPFSVMVAFESQTPTLREQQFEAYKAHRPQVPEDIISAIPLIERFLAAMNIPQLQADGYEADDVIATLALQAQAQGYDVYMMTTDKDYAQLVRPGIYLYRPGIGANEAEILDTIGVLKKYGVPPSQITDLLGLKGDASDNIPGVPKVGDKTALSLLQQFGSLESVLDHAHTLTAKAIKQTLLDNAELARQSKALATLYIDAPVQFDPQIHRRKPYNKTALLDLCQQLEFKSITQRILAADTIEDLFGMPSVSPPASPPSQPAYKTIADVQTNYRIAQTEAEQLALLQTLLSASTYVSFDTETTGLDTQTATLVGLSFATGPGQAWYVPVKSASDVERFRSFYESSTILKVGQNIKYDALILANYGINVVNPMYDTMLAHYCAHAETRHNMEVLAQTYLHYTPIPITDLIGPKGKKQGSMGDVPLEKIAIYAAEDADLTWQFVEHLNRDLDSTQTRTVFETVDMPVMPVLIRMELAGVRIDVAFLKSYSEKMTQELHDLEQQIYQLAGQVFNINSPKQLGEILFDKHKLLEKPEKTKTGQYVTDDEVLQSLAAMGYELPAAVASYRELSKLKSTYIDALPALVSAKTGRVHTSYNQAVAITGRLSSSNPNLQNIPIRTDRGKEIRKAFIPRDNDHILMAVDYSQIELRVMAALSGDVAMQAAFVQGLDIHAATAAKVFGVKLEAVTAEMRRKAKMVNFGIIYGITPYGLAQRLGIGRWEAKQIIDSYFAQYPGVKSFMDSCINQAKATGEARTLTGRLHRIKDINSANPTVRGFAERNAINTPIQGTAADMIKLAMVKVDAIITKAGYKSKMIMQVHDELVFDVYKPELEVLKSEVVKAMTTAMPLDVPLVCSVGIGENWLDAH